MKNYFTYLFLILILMYSCKNDTPKNTELQILTPEHAENLTDSLKSKSKMEITRPCELRTLKETDSLLRRNQRLDEQTYLRFVVNMRIDCAINLEYSEWNNELIFKMLERNPKLFIAFLSRVSRKTNSIHKTGFVLNELKNPIKDAIDIHKLELDLKNTKTEDDEIKAKVLKSLKIAKQKGN